VKSEGKIQSRIIEKLDETMANKQNKLCHSGVEQTVRFLKDADWW
jgi:hypothetical protein